MPSEPTSSDRLELLRQTALRNKNVEEAFDRTVRLLAASLDISLVLIHLIDERDHFYMSMPEAPEPYKARQELTCSVGGQRRR